MHARVCPKKTYTQEEFIDYVTRFQHLPKSQLVGVLDAFIEGLRYLLAEGNIVEMGDLGFFSTSLKCLKETDDEENKIGSKSVVFQNVHLRISCEFRKKMTKEMKFERVHSLTRKQKKITTTVEERMKRLANFLKLNICITRKEYIGGTGLTPYEAMNAEQLYKSGHSSPPRFRQVCGVRFRREIAGGIVAGSFDKVLFNPDNPY